MQVLLPLVALLLVPVVSAQGTTIAGAPDCSEPTPITWRGIVIFAPDESAPFSGAGADCGPGLDRAPMVRDQFFTWTAPSTGEATVWVESLSPEIIAAVSVYEGDGCEATCLATSGLGGIQARCVVDVIEGQTYLIQSGSMSEAYGSGRLYVSWPGVPDTCDRARPIQGEGAWPFTLAGATSSFLNPDAPSASSDFNACLARYGHVGLQRDIYFQWTATCSGSYTVDAGAIGLMLLNVHAGTGCDATCVGTPRWGYQRGYLTGVEAGDTFLFQIGVAYEQQEPSQMLVVTRRGSACNAPPLEFLCDPSQPNASGRNVTLTSSTFREDGGPSLRLRADGGPPGEFGMLLVASDGMGTMPMGNGVLCLQGGVGRYDALAATRAGVPDLDSVGTFAWDGRFDVHGGSGFPTGPGPGYDLPLELPFITGGSITAGDTFCFQLWYRDRTSNGVATSNASDVLRVTF